MSNRAGPVVSNVQVSVTIVAKCSVPVTRAPWGGDMGVAPLAIHMQTLKPLSLGGWVTPISMPRHPDIRTHTQFPGGTHTHDVHKRLSALVLREGPGGTCMHTRWILTHSHAAWRC